MKSKRKAIVGLTVIFIGLVVIVRQLGSVWRLVKAGDRIKQAKTELSQLESDNLQLKQRLAQIDSPEFIEKEARDKLGLGREGETILILPEQSSDQKEDLASDSRPNWKQWWDLYIRI